jgi:hypothetical protein
VERPLQQMIFQRLQMMTSLPKKKDRLMVVVEVFPLPLIFLGMEVGNEEP